MDDLSLSPADIKRFAEEAENGMLKPQAPLLSETIPAVPKDHIGSPGVQAVTRRLLEVASAQQRSHYAASQKKRRTLVGLAAPQIGEPYRIVVVDTEIKPDRKKPGKLECFINPEIIWRARETEEDREGCFSTGPVWGLVRRPVAIKLRAYAPDGKRIERILEGFTARIAQHEIDHLDGIRFPERIAADRKRHWVHTEELAEYPGRIRRWPRTVTREQWEAFKRP
jgi:peptide deformylase